MQASEARVLSLCTSAQRVGLKQMAGQCDESVRSVEGADSAAATVTTGALCPRFLPLVH
jgi:hypothetical protein